MKKSHGKNVKMISGSQQSEKSNSVRWNMIKTTFGLLAENLATEDPIHQARQLTRETVDYSTTTYFLL